MAPRKAKLDEQELDAPGNDAELDQAIDDLRGVLKADEQGTSGGDFGMDFAAAGDNDAFGGDFGADTAAEVTTGFNQDPLAGRSRTGSPSRTGSISRLGPDGCSHRALRRWVDRDYCRANDR